MSSHVNMADLCDLLELLSNIRGRTAEFCRAEEGLPSSLRKLVSLSLL